MSTMLRQSNDRVQQVHNARRAELDDMLSQMMTKTEQLGALAAQKAKLTQYRAAAVAKVEVSCALLVRCSIAAASWCCFPTG